MFKNVLLLLGFLIDIKKCKFSENLIGNSRVGKTVVAMKQEKIKSLFMIVFLVKFQEWFKCGSWFGKFPQTQKA